MMTYWIEKWKDIELPDVCPDSKYQVSDHGQIRKWDAKSNSYKILKQSLSKGYKVVTLKAVEGTKRVTKPVHKIVALTFVEQENKDHEFIIHIDFNKQNNKVTNLKWVSRRELSVHHRQNPNYRTGRRNYSKLTETEVIRIKLKLKRGKTALYKIAKEFGITHTQLNRIRSGENWSSVKID